MGKYKALRRMEIRCIRIASGNGYYPRDWNSLHHFRNL